MIAGAVGVGLVCRGFGLSGLRGDGLGVDGLGADLGLPVALLFVTFNMLREEYGIAVYLTFAGHARRVLLTWNMAFLTALVVTLAIQRTGGHDFGGHDFGGHDFGGHDLGGTVLFYATGLLGVVWCRALVVFRLKASALVGKVSATRVVLVGAERELNDFAARYQPWTLGVDVVASAVLRGPDTLAVDLALAAASARVLRPDDVYVLVPWSDDATIDACVAAFMKVPASIHLGPQPVLDRFSKASVSRVGRISSLHLVRPPLTTTQVLLKRVFDVVVGAALLVALLPAFALVALAIRLDGPGPVFFLQRRHGFNQETFRIVKFRTMRVAEDGTDVVQAARDDPRVTRVGRFLRRHSIDELPQLLNVLRGEMSLVGPRPHALAHNQRFERSIAAYARRHNVKPGITGWAQINGLRGAIASDEVMALRVDHDLYYIDNWTFGLDLRILGMTVLSSRAYDNAF